MLSNIQPFDKDKLEKDSYIMGSYMDDDMKRLIVYSTIENTPYLTEDDKAQLRSDTLAQP